MRKFLILLRREVTSYFHTPIAYVVIFYFLLLTGFNFVSAVTLMNRGPSEVTVVEAFFNTTIFWFTFVLIFPLITMRTYAEEFRLGTVEPLTTAPVRDVQVVLAKFGGSLVFYCIMWLPSVLYFVLFEAISKESAANSAGAWGGSYLMLFLLGMFYLSIGNLASALTRDQINAAVISFSLVSLAFFMGLLSMLLPTSTPYFQEIIRYFSALDHMGDFSRGIIDTKPIVYYCSMTALMLFLTYHVFQYRKWKV